MRAALLVLLIALPCPAADLLPPAADRELAREIYRQMIETKSGFTTGATTPIVEAVAARLKAAGFADADIFTGGANPRKANLVVRYHGTGQRKPILLLAHLDVVEALRADWTTDPFTLLEKDGYFLPVIEVQAKYHRPAVYDDTVTVITTLREKPSLRISLDYEIRRGDELLVTGKTSHVFIDRDGRPTRPPATFTEKMNALFAS